jgi:hypothetical protein
MPFLFSGKKHENVTLSISLALKRHDEAASAARTRRSAMTEDEPVWLFLVPIHKGAYNAALRAVYVMEFFQKAPREQQEMVTSSFHEMMTLVRASMSTRPIKRALYRRRLHATRKDPAVPVHTAYTSWAPLREKNPNFQKLLVHTAYTSQLT